MAQRAQRSRPSRFNRMKQYDETHILALDVRHSRIGYALFSGPKRLLDWGAGTVPPRCNNRTRWIQRRLERLLRQTAPVLVVAREQRRKRLPRNATGKPILKAIQSLTEAEGVPMHSIGRDEIDSAFRIFKARTKDEIACVLVEIFPEMLTRLPPKRKKWQTEPHRMIIFDAIATGFAYWQRPPPRN